MTSRPEQVERKQDLVRLAVLVALCLGLFFFGLGSRALWDIDEGMHAVTSQEMIRTGDWLAPQFNGEPFHDKPPLYNWLVALSFLLFGFTEFAARFPAALLGLALVLVTYAFGRSLVGRKAAFMGAIVLATSLEFVVLSRTVVHDVVLVLPVGLALFVFHRGYVDERLRGRSLVLMYVSIGFAILGKGPLGAVLAAGVVGVYLALRRDWGFVRQMMIFRGALIVFAIAAPFYVAMSLRDPTYLRYFLLEQNIGNFVSAAPRHPEPFWYYVPVLLAGLFPWSPFLPYALGRFARRRDSVDTGRLFLLVWFAVMFVFFSSATSKLGTYVLPLFPAAALLLGDLWSTAEQAGEHRARRGLRYSQSGTIALVVCLLIVGWFRVPGDAKYDAAVHQLPLLVLAGIFVIHAVAAARFLWGGRTRALFATNAATTVALLFYSVIFVFPLLDPYRSSKGISGRIDQLLPPGERIVFLRQLRDSAMFYTGRQSFILRTQAAIDAHLLREGSLGVIDENDMRLVGHLQGRFRVVDRYGDKLILEGLGEPDAPALPDGSGSEP